MRWEEEVGGFKYCLSGSGNTVFEAWRWREEWRSSNHECSAQFEQSNNLFFISILKKSWRLNLACSNRAYLKKSTPCFEVSPLFFPKVISYRGRDQFFFLKNEKNSFNVNDRLCCCYVATAVTVVAMIYSKFMVYFIFCFANISLKALFSYTILFICCGCGAIYIIVLIFKQ